MANITPSKEVMFKDLKVVELASVLAGPAVGMFFAELGAEVIKIENATTGGDVTRNWKISGEGEGISAYYSSVNWNKKSLLLDLGLSAHKQQLLELIKTADVLIVNYKPGDAEKLGLDYNSLVQTNPKLIYASLTGFANQPDRVAYDVVLQAETGFMFMNGSQESGPVKMPVALIDILAAHQLKEAILIALLRKEKEGKGSYIETSLQQAAIASLANHATNWLMNGHDPQRIGSLHPNIAPYGESFTSADGVPFVLAVGAENQFRSLCSLINKPELADDPRFVTNQERVKNRLVLATVLKESFVQTNYESLQTELRSKKIPFGRINSVKEVFNDPIAKGMVLQEKIEGRNTQRVKTVAFTIK